MSFCSDTVSFKAAHERLYIRAYPNCSKATIFSISEQTIPSALLATSVLWECSLWIYLRRKKTAMLAAVPVREHIAAFGNLSFCASSSQFYNEKKEEIYFTSMQRSFMKMLMESEDKKCQLMIYVASYGRERENAKESLNTLVRRLKPIVESNTNLKIVTDKGGYYRLSLKNT